MNLPEGSPVVNFNKLVRKQKREPNPDILEGIPAIANFLSKSYVTIHKWIQNNGLPAAISPSGRWLTTKQIVIEWLLTTAHQDQSRTPIKADPSTRIRDKSRTLFSKLDDEKNSALHALYSNDLQASLKQRPRNRLSPGSSI